LASARIPVIYLSIIDLGENFLVKKIQYFVIPHATFMEDIRSFM